MAPVFVAFGERRLEVLSHKGFEAVCQQAEAALSLHPQSYELHDACGKVDAESFPRASRGMCVLELREKPEWQKMREMEKQIQMLMERTSDEARSKAAKEIEEKVLEKAARSCSTYVDLAMEKLKEDRQQLEADLVTLDVDVTADLAQLRGSVVALEAAAEAAAEGLATLRGYAAEQLRHVGERVERVEQTEEATEATEATALRRELQGVAKRLTALEGAAAAGAAAAAAAAGGAGGAGGGGAGYEGSTAKQELQSLRPCMSEKFFKMDRAKTAWSDGFTTHHLPVDLKRRLKNGLSKSLPQLPPLPVS